MILEVNDHKKLGEQDDIDQIRTESPGENFNIYMNSCYINSNKLVTISHRLLVLSGP